MSSKARQMSDVLLKRWCPGVTGDVLSIGSQDDRDGAGHPYRKYFSAATSYTTSEVRPMPGCDLVVDVRRMLNLPSGSYDCVFCSGVLEHVDAVHEAVGECFRILRPGGLFLVGVPFQQRLHCVPQDFWRFTEFGIQYLLRAFAIEAIEVIGDDRKFPWTYWVKARKPA